VTSGIWTFRQQVEAREPASLEGFSVLARDGRIGHVDEATTEVDESHIVVDVGPWILGRRVVIPAGFVERVQADHMCVYLALSKAQIEDSPELDEAIGVDELYRTRSGAYFDPYRAW